MPKTITLRIDDSKYKIIKEHARNDNRPLSNFIETATLRYIEEMDDVDEFEMNEILGNKNLMKSLKQGSQDAKKKKGRFA